MGLREVSIWSTIEERGLSRRLRSCDMRSIAAACTLDIEAADRWRKMAVGGRWALNAGDQTFGIASVSEKGLHET